MNGRMFVCVVVDEEVHKQNRNEPFIVVVDSDDITEYIVYVESQFLVCTSNLGDALANLMCAYFVFDIIYPRPLYPLLIFIQNTAMGIKDSQKLPTSVCTLLTSISTIP